MGHVSANLPHRRHSFRNFHFHTTLALNVLSWFYFIHCAPTPLQFQLHALKANQILKHPTILHHNLCEHFVWVETFLCNKKRADSNRAKIGKVKEIRDKSCHRVNLRMNSFSISTFLFYDLALGRELPFSFLDNFRAESVCSAVYYNSKTGETIFLK